MGMEVVLSVEAVDGVMLWCRAGLLGFREPNEATAAEVMAESPDGVRVCSRPWLCALDDGSPAVTDTVNWGSR